MLQKQKGVHKVSFKNQTTEEYQSASKIFLLSILIFLFILNGYKSSTSQEIWVGSWATAPQLVEPRNMPPEPGLSNNSLRQILRVSIGGEEVRLKFSNEFSKSLVTMKAVNIAVSKGGSEIDPSTLKKLQFSGKEEITMTPGTVVFSDPISFKLEPRMDVAVTIYFGETSPDVTGHPGSRTTSYILRGKNANKAVFSDAATAERWYVINGLDVKAAESTAAIAILGNSITDGRGSGTNKQNRWPDILAEQLLKNSETSDVAVLNMGIGGNCVLRNCLGPAAIDRFERDVLKQSNVKWLIILEGVNDLGQTRNEENANQVADNLIAAYKKMIEDAHDNNIKVYGATILPFGESFYYADYREPAREKVNHWIRNSGQFDAVIDFDKTMQDPQHPGKMMESVHSGDYLHPNELGYKKMGESINLGLFE